MARDERIYPDFTSGNFAFHLFRYLWALPFAYDRIVLDAGSGSGYGADLLAAVARKVVAVDYDREVVTESRARYAHRSNLVFRVENVEELSYPDESFDLIVSFEVYEHLEAANSERFLRHLSRLCRPGGRVLLSTPNRLVEAPYMKGRSYPYHVNSVSPAELKVRLRAHFRFVKLFGQRVKAPGLRGILRALDPFNLRHRLLSYSVKKRLDKALSEDGFGARPNLGNIRLASSFVRQSGVIVAACSR